MASIKTHIFAGHDAGTESCDFRGDNSIGKAQGDEHRTIPQLEVDPAPELAVEEVLLAGPVANQEVQDALHDVLGGKYTAVAQALHKVLGGDGTATVFGIREGVWDD